MSELKIFVPIKKIDEEHRLVYGTVAAQVRDNSGETFDYDKSKPYFEKWSDNAYQTSGGKSYGNVRVMHTSKVAGLVASPLGFNDEDKTIEACAKVVDDEEWKKVLTGCYTGFSMGGRYVERVKKGEDTHYVADPVEISLVDKPCIPTATFSVIKADGVIEDDHRFDMSLWDDGTLDLEKVQPREPKGSSKGGQFASTKGGGSAHVAHGGSDASGHGGSASQGTLKHHSPAEVGQNEAKKDARYVERRHGRDPGKLREVAAHHEKTAANYRKAGVDHSTVSQIEHQAAHVRRIADKWETETKKSDGGNAMSQYVPTNDEVLPFARELAKAAGNEGGWIDFVEQAREQMMSKADGDKHDSETSEGEDCIKCADMAQKKDEGSEEETEGEEGSGGSEEETDGEEGGDKPDAPEEETEGEAKKADEPELQQGWKAKDGSFHLKKADAIAHNAAIDAAMADEGAVESELVKSLRSIADDVSALAKGEVPGPNDDDSDGDDGSVEKTEVEGWADLCAKAEELGIDADGRPALAKSMYGVSRLASCLREVASIQISTAREAKREEDNSPLPGMITEAASKLGDTLVAMAKEEVEELMAQIANDGQGSSDPALATEGRYDDYFELAASTMGLAKSDLLDGLKKADPVEQPEDEMVLKLDEANKRADEAMAKADAATGELDTVKDLVKSLQASIEELKKQPQPKAPTTVVTKGDEAGPAAPVDNPLSKFTPDQLADAAFRLAHQHGQHLSLSIAGGR